jgi:hypothetical protein
MKLFKAKLIAFLSINAFSVKKIFFATSHHGYLQKLLENYLIKNMILFHTNCNYMSTYIYILEVTFMITMTNINLYIFLQKMLLFRPVIFGQT